MNDYQRIERAIAYIDQHFSEQPSLRQIADHVGLSDFHFQKLFKRWAGISPKRFIQYLTAQYSGALLRDSHTNLSATLASGLSSSSRLHDLITNVYAMSPEQYRNCGETLLIEYGWHPTPFGQCLVAATGKGLCWMSFHTEKQAALAALKQHWPAAELAEQPAATSAAIDLAFYHSQTASQSIMLHIKGTNLQIRVWEALLRIPFGRVTAYSDVAASIGQPRAVRAVASAIGQNPISYWIPCHRVLRKTGAIGGYGGGIGRKRAMLVWEGTQNDLRKTA